MSTGSYQPCSLLCSQLFLTNLSGCMVHLEGQMTRGTWCIFLFPGNPFEKVVTIDTLQTTVNMHQHRHKNVMTFLNVRTDGCFGV